MTAQNLKQKKTKQKKGWVDNLLKIKCSLSVKLLIRMHDHLVCLVCFPLNWAASFLLYRHMKKSWGTLRCHIPLRELWLSGKSIWRGKKLILECVTDRQKSPFFNPILFAWLYIYKVTLHAKFVLDEAERLYMRDQDKYPWVLHSH